MTITYPVSLPSTPAPSSVNWAQANVVAVSTNPYSLKSQIQHFGGEGWGIEVSYDPMSRAQAASFFAFFGSLRGQYGTFTFGDTLMKSPIAGGSLGSPTVVNNNESGYTLATHGWTHSILVLSAGDMIQIGTSLYQLTANAMSNGSGVATLDIWPSSRGHSAETAIVFSNPKGLFRLTDSIVKSIEAPSTQYYNIAFTAEEAL